MIDASSSGSKAERGGSGNNLTGDEEEPLLSDADNVTMSKLRGRVATFI